MDDFKKRICEGREFLFFSFLGVLMVSCGGGGGNGLSSVVCLNGPSAPQLAAFEEHYCVPMGEVLCGIVETCDCAVVPGFPDPAECMTAWLERCRARALAFADAFDDGTLVFCPGAAGRCVEAYRKATGECGDGWPEQTLPAGCVQMVSSVVKAGETCVLPGIGCSGGSGICSPYDAMCSEAVPGWEEPCEGVCQEGFVCGSGNVCVPGNAGDACVSERDCATPLTCVEHRCAPALEPGVSCETDIQCRAGLACVDGVCDNPPILCDFENTCGDHAACVATRARVCRPAAGSGEGCANSGDCVGSSWCDAGFCEPLPELDEPCALQVYCAPGLACDWDSGMCRPLPGLGEACAFGEMGPFVCAEGLACLGDVCGPLPQEGETCGSGNHACGPGLGCSFNTDGTSTCEPQVGAGFPCTNDRQCTYGTYCEYSLNLCASWVAWGNSCNDGNECGPEGSCLPRTAGGGFVCAPMPEVGEACYLECVPDAVCRFLETEGVCAAPVCGSIPF